MKRTSIAALVLSTCVLAACTPDVEETPSPTPSATAHETTATPSPSPTPTSESPTPSPSPTSTLDADQLAAQEVVNQFFLISDELKRDPDASLQPLADITTGQTQTVYINEIRDYRAADAVLIGEITRTVIGVGSVSDRDGDRVVSVEVCTDSSAADVVDRETQESILPADRKPVVYWRIDAITENTFWKVGDIATSTSEESCEP